MKSLSKLKIIRTIRRLQLKTTRRFIGKILSLIFPEGKYVETNFGKIWINFKDKNYGWYYFKNPFLQDEHKIFIEMLQRHEPNVIIDIGAHWGVLAAHISRYNKNPKKIICLEPDPSNYVNLQKTLTAIRDIDTVPVNAAISNVDGRVSATKSNGACLQIYNTGSSMLEVQSFTLQTVIDDFDIDVSLVSHIKVDVDGYEPEILQQIVELDLRSGTLILMEFCPKALLSNGCDPEKWIEEMMPYFFIEEQDVVTGRAIAYQKGIVSRLEKRNAHLTNLILERV